MFYKNNKIVILFVGKNMFLICLFSNEKELVAAYFEGRIWPTGRSLPTPDLGNELFNF